ncbi:BrnT family toxin [Roseospirillum parvum]|uniref:Uncharacterized protein n=1 Tax=Roseospirillum parvum TaxID=83401 RepID=A0A1G8B301_9PROT|nr:BrnT family toxin [Roseospirillum parvum]SDH27546.1 hypothetical protein SAMN05421742_105192 [Roseospirillum parvum]
MDTQWDPRKSDSNRRKHGIAFDAVSDFDWDFAALAGSQIVDGEERELILGPIGNHLFALVATWRGEACRVISLRRATNREIALWRKEFEDG